MFHHILVPLDGTDIAELAIPFAARIAHATGGSLTLVRVIHTSIQSGSFGAEPVTGLAPTMLETQYALAHHYLATIPKMHAAELAGIPLETDVELGATTPAIESAARLEQADMIVLCSRGKTSLASWVVGSVARQLTRHSPIPILVLNAHGHPSVLPTTPSWRITIPLDGSKLAESALEPALQFATTLCSTTPWELHLVQAIALPRATNSRWRHQQADSTQQVEKAMLVAEDYLQTVITRLKEGLLASQHVVFTTSVIGATEVGTAIVQHVEHTQSLIGGECADLIAMTTHGRSGVQHILLGSVAEKVLSNTKCPVLITRPVMQSGQDKSKHTERSISRLS